MDLGGKNCENMNWSCLLGEVSNNGFFWPMWWTCNFLKFWSCLVRYITTPQVWHCTVEVNQSASQFFHLESLHFHIHSIYCIFVYVLLPFVHAIKLRSCSYFICTSFHVKINVLYWTWLKRQESYQYIISYDFIFTLELWGRWEHANCWLCKVLLS